MWHQQEILAAGTPPSPRTVAVSSQKRKRDSSIEQLSSWEQLPEVQAGAGICHLSPGTERPAGFLGKDLLMGQPWTCAQVVFT